ncbi:hypothetical protein GQ607_011766 [Colletotrichum asianum]|uniref:Uncharacterized protein n=1 Tax=Colletotrichum asianum TaxID=702518 RepID=A0A8H3ZIZ3_9PEZI|nr:hypothetical protein GQ607_011766 [Colletotrichum asianum]
MLIPSFYFF